MMPFSDKRWSLINKKTGKVRRSLTTRDAARFYKRGTERIFDNTNLKFVR